MLKNTLVIGASENPERYSYKAIKMLHVHGIPTQAVGLKSGMVDSVTIHKELVPFENIHTVTMYVGPQNQHVYIPYILSLQPKRIIFNPGAENETLAQMATDKGIEVVEACTLVLLSTNQF